MYKATDFIIYNTVKTSPAGTSQIHVSLPGYEILDTFLLRLITDIGWFFITSIRRGTGGTDIWGDLRVFWLTITALRARGSWQFIWQQKSRMTINFLSHMHHFVDVHALSWVTGQQVITEKGNHIISRQNQPQFLEYRYNTYSPMIIKTRTGNRSRHI